MHDIIIIGGGIVGVSTAWQLSKKYPGKKILLLEKEATLACHQTGRNSGVLHAGIYYQPKSLKARFCRRGLNVTLQFCDQHNIPYEQRGKLLVATSDKELTRMEALYQRSIANGVNIQKLGPEALQEIEPALIGKAALQVPETAIVNYTAITQAIAEEFSNKGGDIQYQTKVTGLSETPKDVTVKTTKGIYQAKYLIVCAGLMADRLAQMMDVGHDFRIIPYRGEYYRLPDKYSQLIKHLIYPIPDPALPFLGVHLTPMMGGYLTVGPNALQGWKREGYGNTNFSIKDAASIVGFPGFWKVSAKHWQAGLREMAMAYSKKRYLKQVQKYCPQIAVEDLLPQPAGVRAQGVMKDGSMVHDFLFAETLRSLHVCNAPSPAATSAIPIGEYLCHKVEMRKVF